jgi:hypothetical protein
MQRLSLLPLVLLALGTTCLQAQEFRAGVGLFTLGKEGLDLQMDVRPKLSHWQVGIKYVHWMDTSRDPFTGRKLTETTQTKVGPFVNYLFRPDSWGTWYLGGSVLRWSKAEQSMYTGEVGKASTTSPYVGGGFTGSMGRHFYFNMGLFLSPGAQLKTQTSVSSEQDSGGFDIQIQVGAKF